MFGGATILKVLGGAALVYAAFVAVVAFSQDSLIFPRWAMGSGTTPLPPEAARLTVRAASGEELQGVHLPGTTDASAPVLLGFGGNAWDADALALYLRSVFPEHDIVTFHFRGYGPSEGRPSASALIADAPLLHDAVAERLTPRPIIPVGLSIGAGPAAEIAAGRDVAGMILVTPFDSLRSMAQTHYPWLPVRWLLRHRMEIAEAVARSEVPTAIITAERDSIVPARRSAPVRTAARNLVLDRVIAGAGHNDLYQHPDFRAAMAAALERIEAAG